MAAPMLSKGETKSTLGETVKQKQKKEIKKHKNVLFNPFAYKWPVINKYFEGRILDELQSVLKSVPIKLPRRPASYFKGKKQTDNEQQLCEEEKNAENERRKLRSQIVCGVREVTRGLEKDDLDLIIVCRSTKPSLITKHLIPLAASRGCPALCIPEFNPKISPLLGVTSVVALGFKKVAAGSESSFHEFVTYSKSKAPPLNTPWLNRSLEVNSFDGTDPTTLLESSADRGAGDTSAVSDDVSKDRNSRENSQCETDLISFPDKSLTPVMSSGFISLESDSDRKLLEDSKNKFQAKKFTDNLETGFLSLSPVSHNDPDEDASPSQSQLSFFSKEAGKSPTKNTAHKEAGKSPTKSTADKEAGKSPTKSTADKEAGKSPTKSTADKEAGKSPTKNTADKEAGKSPTKNTADKEAGKSPTKNTADKEAGKSPTKSTGDKEAGKSPTKSTAYKEAGKSPTRITAHKEAGKSPTKSTAYKEAGKSPTKSTADKEAGKSPTKNTAYKEAGKSPTRITAHKEAGKSPTKSTAYKEAGKSPTKSTADKEAGKSPTKNTDDKEAGKGVRFVFPVDGPPPFVPKKDYSHLYVYKSGGSFGDSFIPLSGSKGHKRVLSPQRSTSESESAEEEVLGILGMEQPVAKKPKHSSNVDKSGSYRPAVVRTMIPNLNKKRKRKR